MAATKFLYYCSLQDVKDNLFDIDFIESDPYTSFTPSRIRRAISKAYGEINAALKTGGYTVPVGNGVKSENIDDITGDPNFPVTFAITTGDGSLFDVGDTIRIHGSDGEKYVDEFTGIVSISTNNLEIEFLENTYLAAGSTIELCTEGFLFIRNCNAIGAAAKLLLGKVVGQAKSQNENVISLQDEFTRCLNMIRDGKVGLDGLAQAGSVIQTYQTRNEGASDIPDRCIKIGMDF